MMITKYCDEKYHPQNATHIKIGTLYEYRDHKNDAIADPQEGSLPSHRFEDGVQISAEQAEQIGVQVVCKIPQNVVFAQADETSTIESNLNIKIPNQYIFCASNETQGSPKTCDSLGYETWYTIRDVAAFMHEISEYIRSQAKFELARIHKFDIKPLCRPVEYWEDKLKVHHGGYSGNAVEDAIFTKPERSRKNPSIDYTVNNEYRLAWICVDAATNTLHSVKNESLFVPITPVIRNLII